MPPTRNSTEFRRRLPGLTSSSPKSFGSLQLQLCFLGKTFGHLIWFDTDGVFVAIFLLSSRNPDDDHNATCSWHVCSLSPYSPTVTSSQIRLVFASCIWQRVAWVFVFDKCLYPGTKMTENKSKSILDIITSRRNFICHSQVLPRSGMCGHQTQNYPKLLQYPQIINK